MNDDYFLSLNYSPIHLLDQFYEESLCEKNYYLSPVNVWRCDVSASLRAELSKIINIPFADCGFLKTKPQSTYPFHIDAFRIAALNLPLFEETEGFISSFLDKEKFVSLPIPYTINQFHLLNVSKHHGVINKTTDKERIMLSIGITNYNFNDLKELFYRNRLLNVI